MRIVWEKRVSWLERKKTVHFGARGGWEPNGSIVTNWISGAETKTESVGFVEVERVGVEDTNVHLPFLVVVGRDEADAWREGLVDLLGGFRGE